MHGPQPGAQGGPGRRMCGPRPGAPEGPGRKKMCNPRLGTREEKDVQPSTGSSRSSLATEQGENTDHPWIYLNNILE